MHGTHNVKFDTLHLRIIPLNNCESREIRYNESHVLLKGVNEILTFFYCFRLTWIKLCTEDVHKQVLSSFIFVKIGAKPVDFVTEYISILSYHRW